MLTSIQSKTFMLDIKARCRQNLCLKGNHSILLTTGLHFGPQIKKLCHKQNCRYVHTLLNLNFGYLYQIFTFNSIKVKMCIKWPMSNA